MDRKIMIGLFPVALMVTVLIAGLAVAKPGNGNVGGGGGVGPAKECNDGLDNDGDGLIDYQNDPGCNNKNDRSELGTVECDDGIDNDGDSLIDMLDSGCADPSDTTESLCGNGIINAGDGELCDDGSNNGISCSPAYGESCSYCSNSCTIENVQGNFCGDLICNGPENLNTCPGDCPVSSGQTFLPFDRSIDWKPGIPGGIPFYNVSVDVTSFGAVGDGVTNATVAIQSALDAAPANSAVWVPAGDYKTTSAIYIPNGVALRGDGPDNTRIKCDIAAGHCLVMSISQSSSFVSMTSGYQKGSTHVQVADASSFSVGDYVELREDHDPNLFQCGGSCPSWGLGTMGQVNIIIAVADNTLTLQRPLYMTYSAAVNPRIRANPKIEFAGIEDLTLERIMHDSGSGANIRMSGAAHSWVRNIWSEKSLTAHVWMLASSYGNVVRDSVFNDTWLSGTGGQGYGIRLEKSSDNLFENNLFNHLRHSMVIQSGSSGNVFGYGFSKDPYSTVSPTWLYSDIALHGHYPTMNLFEGNVGQYALVDDVHGNNGPSTFFRNRILRDVVYVTGADSKGHIGISDGNGYQNVIGNELGLPGQIASNGVVHWKTNTRDTGLEHGNYEYLTPGITNWEPSLDPIMPASLYLESEPSWFGNLILPVFGPHNANAPAVMTPAWERFEALRAQGRI